MGNVNSSSTTTKTTDTPKSFLWSPKQQKKKRLSSKNTKKLKELDLEKSATTKTDSSGGSHSSSSSSSSHDGFQHPNHDEEHHQQLRQKIKGDIKKKIHNAKKKRVSSQEARQNLLGPTLLFGSDVSSIKDMPESMKVLRQWLTYKDEHNISQMLELTTDDCFFGFVDAEAHMPAREFYGAMNDIYKSFPNLHFFWTSMNIVSINDDDDGDTVKIVVQDYYGIGKHTGDPYFFGPYEPIEAKGIEVRDEDIEFTFTLTEDKATSSYKISDAKIDAHGKVVGPPGFYTKIGGLIF